MRFDDDKQTIKTNSLKLSDVRAADIGVPGNGPNTLELVTLSDKRLTWYTLNVNTAAAEETHAEETPFLTEKFRDEVIVRSSGLTAPSNPRGPIDRFTNVWMNWNASAAAVAYKMSYEQDSNVCLLLRHQQQTNNGEPSERLSGVRSTSYFPLNNDNEFFSMKPIWGVKNCSRVV